jgi:hypothetical protein
MAKLAVGNGKILKKDSFYGPGRFFKTGISDSR